MANGESDSITIRTNGSSATVHLFGATLTSWKPNGSEALFVSAKSHFDNQTPIRGGVPVIFPQFGPWECGPQHGFARRMKWSIKEGEQTSSKVTLVLEESEATLKLWKYRFRFEYTLALVSDTELKMNVVITNRDENEFDFTFLLHTYFSVPNIEDCTITGLKGCNYIDKVRGGMKSVEENEVIKISEFTDSVFKHADICKKWSKAIKRDYVAAKKFAETNHLLFLAINLANFVDDRIYLNTPSVNKISHISSSRLVAVVKDNLPDTVVWNPWKENAKKMSDFGDDEYKSMVCVEAGFVGTPYSLISGDSFKASQLLKVL